MERQLLKIISMILHDQCPPDNTMYLCSMGEECEHECVRCWENYVMYVTSRGHTNPYAMDRRREERLM